MEFIWRLCRSSHLVSLFCTLVAVIFILFLYKTKNNIWRLLLLRFLALIHWRVETVAWRRAQRSLKYSVGMASLYAYSVYTETKKWSHYLVCLMLFPGLFSQAMYCILCFYWCVDYCHLIDGRTYVGRAGIDLTCGKMIGRRYLYVYKDCFHGFLLTGHKKRECRYVHWNFTPFRTFYQQYSFLYVIFRKDILSIRSCHFLSIQVVLARMADLSLCHYYCGHYIRCYLLDQNNAIFIYRLVLVFRNSCSGNRFGAGWRTGHGR